MCSTGGYAGFAGGGGYSETVGGAGDLVQKIEGYQGKQQAVEGVCVCGRGVAINTCIESAFITHTYQVVAETLCTSAETAMAARRQKNTSELKYINMLSSDQEA